MSKVERCGPSTLALCPLVSGLVAWCTSLDGGGQEAHCPQLPLFLLEEKFYHLLELMTEAINLFTNSTLPSVTVCWAGLGLRGPGHSTRSGHVPPGCQACILVSGQHPPLATFSTSSLMWYVARMHQWQAGCVLSLPCGAPLVFYSQCPGQEHPRHPYGPGGARKRVGRKSLSFVPSSSSNKGGISPWYPWFRLKPCFFLKGLTRTWARNLHRERRKMHEAALIATVRTLSPFQN